MLSPFPGHLPGTVGALSGVDAAALGRRIRDEAGRYQPWTVLDAAVAGGELARLGEDTLFRYEVRRDGRLEVAGLVGLARAADLIPHEETLEREHDRPAPAVEIRPVLALIEASLPDTEPLGRRVEAIADGHCVHSVTPVRPVALPEGSAPVIADGHHRRRAVITARGPEGMILTLVVGERGRGLSAGAFHRVFPDAVPLPDAAAEVFDIEPLPAPHVVEGALVWIEGRSGRASALWPRSLDSLPELLRGSPAAIARELLYPLLGVDDDHARHFGAMDPALLEVARTGGLLLLPEADASVVIAAARGGVMLPPKATRFSPKPLRGLVMRPVAPRPA